MKKALREENCSRRIALRKRTNGKGRIKRRSCDQTGRRVRTESSGPGNRSGKQAVGNPQRKHRQRERTDEKQTGREQRRGNRREDSRHKQAVGKPTDR